MTSSIETTWMRKGKSHNSVIGKTQIPQTMASWVYIMNAFTTLINDLQNMSDDTPKVNNTHKEEKKSTIEKDLADRLSLRTTLNGCMDLLDLTSHQNGQFINICTGRIAPENVNIWNAVAIRTDQMNQFKKYWPEGFHGTLSKRVITFAYKKRHIKVGDKEIMDPGAIHAQVIGQLISDTEFDFSDVLAFKLGCYPPALFKENGEMRIASAKSDLTKIIGVTVNKRTFGTPTHIIIDVSAFLWTINWPTKGKLSLVIDEIKKYLKALLTKSDVHWINGRYYYYSPKSASRNSREENMASRPH